MLLKISSPEKKLTQHKLKTMDKSTINQVMLQSAMAFDQYKKTKPFERASFLKLIATCIEKRREVLVQAANEETNLPLARLNGEIGRTTGQLTMFASLLEEGSWVEAVIDIADNNRTPPKPDTRKMLLPTGPVIVFGASNFPFAFSTAGGDTASALSAGCTVVVKGHPAHPKTSLLVYEAITEAMQLSGMPLHTVQHVAGEGNDIGRDLVIHPNTAGVGFTGSYKGGKALVEYARQREIPVPVFAEMSSINPVVFLPDTMAQNTDTLAQQFVASLNLGAGQFCTNPGLMLVMECDALNDFLSRIETAIAAAVPQKMLHKGIYNAYTTGVQNMLQQNNITLLAQSAQQPAAMEAQPGIAKVTAAHFLQNPKLHEEVFGPYSLAVVCTNREDMIAVLSSLKGQLTGTIMGTAVDFENYRDIIEMQTTLAGRVILNGAPTGVEVCASMVHGGPYPATTDGRFTSVGTAAIKRWVRPVCFQNFSGNLLPDALQNSNPLNIWRLVNNQFSKDAIL
ncbi:aldehyde dehydrogenase (NADP(+)) [Ferruginibacter profundus]